MASIYHKHYHNKLFALSFSLTFLMFAVAGAAVIFFVNPPVRKTPIPPAAQAYPDRYLPSPEESLTTLAAISTDGKSPPHTYVLIGFEPFQGAVPVLALSPKTTISGEETIADVFAQGNIQQLAERLSMLLDIKIDRVLSMDNSSIASLTNQLGVVEFLLPYEVSYAHMGTRISLTAGVHQLTGEELIAVLSYPDYPGGEVARTQVASELIAASLNKNFGMVHSPDTDVLFHKITSYMNTDITFQDVASRIQAARFLSTLQVAPAQAVVLNPLPSEENERILLPPKALTLIRKKFHQ